MFSSDDSHETKGNVSLGFFPLFFYYVTHLTAISCTRVFFLSGFPYPISSLGMLRRNTRTFNMCKVRRE